MGQNVTDRESRGKISLTESTEENSRQGEVNGQNIRQ